MAIKESVEEYKKDLKKLKSFEIINYSIAIFGAIIFIVLYAFNYGENMSLIFLANVLAVVLALDIFAVNLAYVKPQKKKLIEDRQREIIKKLVNESFPGSTYSYSSLPDSGIKPSDICSTGLLSKGINGFDITHNIKSIYKGVPFKFCALKSYSYQTVSSSAYIANNRIPTEKTEKGIDFNGCWFIFNCHIKTNSSLYIVSRGSKTDEQLDYQQKISALRRINVPDNQFNSIFSVFGYDLKTAEYILTPSFMEKLLFLQKRFQSRLYVYCDSGVIYVGIENYKNFFAPMVSVFDSVEGMLQAAQNDIDYIITCLDILDFSDYVTKDYTDFKIQNDSIFYTGKDVDTVYY